MTIPDGGGLATLVLTFAVLMPGSSDAGRFLGSPRCPRSSYSCWHYWAPGLYRLVDRHHGGVPHTYPPGGHTETPPNYMITPFACPSVDPTVLTDLYMQPLNRRPVP